jgi:hypothetical protein
MLVAELKCQAAYVKFKKLKVLVLVMGLIVIELHNARGKQSGFMRLASLS